MPYIVLKEFDQMDGEIQEKLQPIMEKTQGNLDPILKLLALRKDIFNATDGLAKTLLMAQTELPYSTKERIAILVSAENSCAMCVDLHKRVAKMLGMTQEQIDEVLEGVENINCSDEEKTLLKFCVKASKKDNYKIAKEEVDAIKNAGYSESQLFEAVTIVAYFNYINTLSNVFGLSE